MCPHTFSALVIGPILKHALVITIVAGGGKIAIITTKPSDAKTISGRRVSGTSDVDNFFFGVTEVTRAVDEGLVWWKRS
jgi:hypothetical protein